MKKNFELSYKDDIISGKVKVVTRDGRPVEILKWDAKASDGACIIACVETDGEEEAQQFFPDGRAFASRSSAKDRADDLFVITDEPEPEQAYRNADEVQYRKGYDKGYEEGFAAGVKIDEEALTDKIAEKVAALILKDGNPLSPQPSVPGPNTIPWTPATPFPPVTVMYGVTPVPYNPTAVPYDATTANSAVYKPEESEEE